MSFMDFAKLRSEYMATWKNKPPLPKNVEVILTCHNGLKVTN